MSSIEQGQQAESIALHFLQQHGLTMLERNFHTRFGEIDLIMQDADSLVFVEVRYRANTTCGDGAMSVDRRKQHKLGKTALSYLKSRGKNNHICRFDVISVSRDADDSVTIDWIKNAFDYQG